MYLARMDTQTAFGDVRMRGEPVLIQSMSPPRKHRSSQIAAEDGHATIGERGRKLCKEKMSVLLDVEGPKTHTPDMQLHAGRQFLDHVTLQKSTGTDAEGSDSGS